VQSLEHLGHPVDVQLEFFAHHQEPHLDFSLHRYHVVEFGLELQAHADLLFVHGNGVLQFGSQIGAGVLLFRQLCLCLLLCVLQI